MKKRSKTKKTKKDTKIILETEKEIIVLDKEALDILRGIKEGLDDFREGRFKVEEH